MVVRKSPLTVYATGGPGVPGKGGEQGIVNRDQGVEIGVGWSRFRGRRRMGAVKGQNEEYGDVSLR
jgi:hypothetical protein